MLDENASLRDSRYWLINPLAGFLAGTAAGYVLEKSGMPYYSKIDVYLQAGVPFALGSLEYLVEKHVKKQNIVDADMIFGSSALGLATFYFGNQMGRSLAKLI